MQTVPNLLYICRLEKTLSHSQFADRSEEDDDDSDDDDQIIETEEELRKFAWEMFFLKKNWCAF